MVRELQVIRDSIFTALQESEYRDDDPAEARKMIDHCVRLGRLDPGQWAPEALVIAHTEWGLPDPYQYEFWKRATDIANQRDCRVQAFDVTHFTVGFFKDVQVPAEVSRLIERAAKTAYENTRLRLEEGLNFNNVASPIEQMVYVCWETARSGLRSELDPGDHNLGRYRLYPQFPIRSDAGEEYLVDFAIMKFDAAAFRRLVGEWSARQDPNADGNWIMDPYPDERGHKCNENVKLAIECDSYKYHVEELSQSDFEYQKRRERFIQKDGWTVLAFCGREISRDPMKCVDEVHRYLRRQNRESAVPH
jgi:hypothetical protein